MKKIVSMLLVFVLAFVFLPVTAVFAQDASGTAPAGSDPIGALLGVLTIAIVGFIAFYAVGLIVHYGTDAVKVVTRGIAKFPAMKWAGVTGYGSLLAALIISAAAAFYPGNAGLSDSLTHLFSAVNVSIDPTMVKVITTLFVTLLASKQHDSGQLPNLVPTAGAKK